MSAAITPDPFIEVNIKIHRGDDHLNAANTLIRDWAEGGSYRIRGQYNHDRTIYQLVIKFLRPIEMDRLAAITGDVVYNYRCALNYMVHALAVLETGQDPPSHETRLEFPICSVDNCWESAVGRKQLEGLSTAQVALINDAQPRNRSDPGGDVLARLRDLSNADKHRALNVGVFAVDKPKDIKIGPITGPFQLIISGEPLYDGAPIAQVEFPAPHPPVDVDLNLAMRVTLADDPPGSAALVTILSDIRQEVIRLYDILKP